MNENNQKALYAMKLHEKLHIGETVIILRVPGGWVYQAYDYRGSTTTFVPWNNEFQLIGEDK